MQRSSWDLVLEWVAIIVLAALLWDAMGQKPVLLAFDVVVFAIAATFARRATRTVQPIDGPTVYWIDRDLPASAWAARVGFVRLLLIGVSFAGIVGSLLYPPMFISGSGSFLTGSPHGFRYGYRDGPDVDALRLLVQVVLFLLVAQRYALWRGRVSMSHGVVLVAGLVANCWVLAYADATVYSVPHNMGFVEWEEQARDVAIVLQSLAIWTVTRWLAGMVDSRFSRDRRTVEE